MQFKIIHENSNHFSFLEAVNRDDAAYKIDIKTMRVANKWESTGHLTEIKMPEVKKEISKDEYLDLLLKNLPKCLK